MFGFSFSEILIIAAVGVVAWLAIRRARERKRPQGGAGEPAARPDAAPQAEEMTQCPVCGEYVLARAPAACGRKECPYPKRA